MAIPSRYAVKSATLKLGGTTHDMDTGPTMKAVTQNAVEVTALSDSVKKFITGALTEYDEFTVTLFQGEGTDVKAGDSGKLEITATLENGSGTNVTATVVYENVLVTKVAPPSHQASGERKATYDVTIRPDGQESAS